MAETKKSRAGRRRSVFTDEVLATIPFWIGQGADRGDIAAALGTTKDSLSDACSRHGISLRPVDRGIRRRLGPERWGALRREAELRGVSVPQLLVDIAIAVVDENLFPSVLGDYDDLES